MKHRWKLVLAGGALACLGVAGPALGHAELSSSDPKEGAKLATVPEHLYVNYTEPPSGDFSIIVSDGCDRDVVEEAETQDRSLHAILGEGQPGKWKVEYRVISGLDGHPTNGRYSFTVKGEADCDEPVAAPGEPDDDATEEAGGGTTLLFVGLGVLALVGAAVVIRAKGNRSV